MSDNARSFPIQGSLRDELPCGSAPASKIPWWLAEVAYAQYAKLFGTQQSLDRLAERGGFGRGELLMLLRGQNPCHGWSEDRALETSP